MPRRPAIATQRVQQLLAADQKLWQVVAQESRGDVSVENQCSAQLCFGATQSFPCYRLVFLFCFVVSGGWPVGRSLSSA